MRQSCLFIALAATTVGLSGASFASGSDSFSTVSSATGAYNVGKRIYFEKMACDSCMFAGKSIDKELAMKVVSDPKATESAGDTAPLREVAGDSPGAVGSVGA